MGTGQHKVTPEPKPMSESQTRKASIGYTRVEIMGRFNPKMGQYPKANACTG